jgi:hypothetical protein
MSGPQNLSQSYPEPAVEKPFRRFSLLSSEFLYILLKVLSLPNGFILSKTPPPSSDFPAIK